MGNKLKLPLEKWRKKPKPEKKLHFFTKGDKHYLCFVFNKHQRPLAHGFAEQNTSHVDPSGLGSSGRVIEGAGLMIH